MVNVLKNFINRIEKILWSKQAYKFVIKSWTQETNVKKAAQLLNTARFSEQIKPLVMGRPEGKKIAVIAPHPDDEMIGPGGTLIKAAQKGAAIHVIYITSGDDGEAKEREAESQNVCDKLGWHATFFRQAMDISTWDKGILQKTLTALVPDIVMIPFLLDDHDHHREVNRLLLGVADLTAEIWAYQVYSAVLPNVVIDITDVAEKKAEYIHCYKSQMVSRDWAHFALGLNAWTSRFLSTHGQARCAEGFSVMPFADYQDLIKTYYPG